MINQGKLFYSFSGKLLLAIVFFVISYDVFYLWMNSVDSRKYDTVKRNTGAFLITGTFFEGRATLKLNTGAFRIAGTLLGGRTTLKLNTGTFLCEPIFF